MEETKTLHSILQQGYLSSHHISSNLRTLLDSNIELNEKEAILIEIKCFEYSNRDGNLVPKIERIDEKGNRFCYPDLNRFKENEFEYIKQRLSEESHPFLRSRYAHLLWVKNKHNRYAQEAIKAYKELVSLYFLQTQIGAKLHHKLLDALRCFHQLSSTVKYETEKCKQELLFWLKRDELPFLWKSSIADIIIGSPLFKIKDLDGLTALMLSYLEQEQQYGYSACKRYLDALLLLAQKEGVSNKNILALLGENELGHAAKRENDDTGIIPFMCYRQAADYFKRAGAKEKFEEAEKLYAAQKHKIKLVKIRSELSDNATQRYNKVLNELVNDLLSGDPFRPFYYLANEKRILLPKELSEEDIKQQRQNSIMDLFTVEVFDQNNNGKTLREEERIKHYQFQHYSFSLQTMAVILMEKLFYKGFQTGRITQQSFMSFFNQSWLAQPLDGYTVDGQPSHFSWMELFGPGLYGLVKELEGDFLDKEYKPSYLLVIDSLSIKLEGAIRDFAQVAGIPTSKIKENEVQEMNLEELLNHEKVQDLFEKDDVLLWRSVLTKKGWNTRNNTAHSFYRPGNYTRQKALLLLLCVYRLSRYGLGLNEL